MSRQLKTQAFCLKFLVALYENFFITILDLEKFFSWQFLILKRPNFIILSGLCSSKSDTLAYHVSLLSIVAVTVLLINKDKTELGHRFGLCRSYKKVLVILNDFRNRMLHCHIAFVQFSK